MDAFCTKISSAIGGVGPTGGNPASGMSVVGGRCTANSDVSIHVGNSDMSVLSLGSFGYAPAYGDTGDWLSAECSSVEYWFDVTPNPVVESYADCLTDGFVVPA